MVEELEFESCTFSTKCECCITSDTESRSAFYFYIRKFSFIGKQCDEKSILKFYIIHCYAAIDIFELNN